MNDKKLTFLKRFPLFTALAAEDQAYIVKYLTHNNFTRNTILFFQGKSDIENLIILSILKSFHV
jgi:hypothetical protein